MSIPRFGVTRPVPVNLMMAGAIIGGVVCAFTLTREFFPDTTPQQATVSLPYPGALPAEIEEGMAIKVEDDIADLRDVERLTTTLREGGGGITVEFRSGLKDIGKAVDDVERRIDALTDLPDEAEEIQVVELEPQLPVIMVTLHGSADEQSMKRTIHHIRDDLKDLPGMGDIQLSGVRDYEIRVDVSNAALLEHRMSLVDVSRKIESWMSEIPGGSVRTGVGNVSIRTMGVPEQADAIRNIVIKARPEGQVVRLSEVAEVHEGFVDEELMTRFGKRDDDNPGRSKVEPSVSLTVFKTGDQDAVEIAEAVRAYVVGARAGSGKPNAEFQGRLLDSFFGLLNGMAGGGATPDRPTKQLRTSRRAAYDLGYESFNRIPAGCDLSTHSDLARFIEGRLDLLIRNALWGAMLVFATLLVFLNWRVAFWVGVGLTIALCGTLVFMQVFGITLNLLTMFGLIVVLGLLVDDAIVISENIQARHDRKEPALVAAIKGTEQVFWPVVATILTSIVAFLPLRFIQGQIGDLIGALPLVVSCALAFSLVESVLILPSHMGHTLLKRDKREPGKIARMLRRFEQGRDHVIFKVIVPRYGRMLTWLLRYRYATIAVFVSALIVSVGMILGGRGEFTFIGGSDSETIVIDVGLPVGTPIARTAEIVAELEAAAVSHPATKSVMSIVGFAANIDTGQARGTGGHLGQMYLELKAVEDQARTKESSEVIAEIRSRADVERYPDVERLRFTEIQGGFSGADITIDVLSEDEGQLDFAVAQIKRMLGEREGVVDISDNSARAQREVRFEPLPGMSPLGQPEEFKAQIRGALYGLEPHVYSDRREDIKVRVRLDEESRRSLYAIENMYLINGDGDRIPVGEVFDVAEGIGYASITRVDRARAVTITADTTPVARPELVLASMQSELDSLVAENPGLSVELAGAQRQMAKAFSTLPIGFLTACVLIYIILAWLFGSYTQPLAVMLAVPFSLIGIIWGHLLLDYQLTFLSLIGFVALSGVVVNDSLILVDFYNKKRAEGLEIHDALVEAGRQRLRPIFLTTVTTILGLTPLMLEQSFQAKFLIPMAVSISFGLMSATVLILVALPCMLLVFDDIRRLAYYLWTGRRLESAISGSQPALDGLAE